MQLQRKRERSSRRRCAAKRGESEQESPVLATPGRATQPNPVGLARPRRVSALTVCHPVYSITGHPVSENISYSSSVTSSACATLGVTVNPNVYSKRFVRMANSAYYNRYRYVPEEERPDTQFAWHAGQVGNTTTQVGWSVGDQLTDAAGSTDRYDAAGMIVQMPTGLGTRRMIFTADDERIRDYVYAEGRLVGGERQVIDGDSGTAPSWAKGNRPLGGESGKDFATRLMNDKYGRGNWENKKGPGREFNQIKKWGDRGFVDPR